MCVYSMIGDDWAKRWNEQYPEIFKPVVTGTLNWPHQVTREEFEALKKEMQELKDLLIQAKKYDEATGQPDCEMEDKVTLIKKMAEFLGVDMGDAVK